MSQLETYMSPKDHQILAYEGRTLAVNLSPGAEVRHGHFEGTKGLLISNGDDFIVVLWTIAPPGPMFVMEDVITKEIQDKIDADIMCILRAQCNTRP